MTASAMILAIGDELLLGRTVDTNSSYLARWCSDQGIVCTAVRLSLTMKQKWFVLFKPLRQTAGPRTDNRGPWPHPR